jgi:hypothetical protein
VIRGVLIAGLVAATSFPSAPAPSAPLVLLSAGARETMGEAFERSNEHWDELGDLNTMERMLGTIRPTQREFLGCLQGRVVGDTVLVDSWVPAADMKQLQLAVTGSCDSVPALVGTWHTHPYHADLQNLPVKSRVLSPQDLETFSRSRLAATLVMWDRDSLDAAVRTPAGIVVHPARVSTPHGVGESPTGGRASEQGAAQQ